MPAFVKDLGEIRERAIHKIEEGAVTEGYSLDKHKVIEVLNDALATEIVCVLRYQHHYFMATGVHGRAVAGEFREHADEERDHADKIAERIQQLGGKPDFNPASLLQRSVSHYVEGETLADMIKEDLIAERIVIEVYQQMIEFFGLKDPTSRTMLEGIKAQEEEHASDLADMLFIVDPHSGKDRGQDPGTDPLRTTQTGELSSAGRQRNQPAASAQQSQPIQAGTPQQQAVFDPEKSRAMRHQTRSDDQGEAAEAEDRVHLEGESAPPASDIGGVSGRPMSRRETKLEAVRDDARDTPAEGRMTGTNRSPKLIEKNRKRRTA